MDRFNKYDRVTDCFTAFAMTFQSGVIIRKHSTIQQLVMANGIKGNEVISTIQLSCRLLHYVRNDVSNVASLRRGTTKQSQLFLYKKDNAIKNGVTQQLVMANGIKGCEVISDRHRLSYRLRHYVLNDVSNMASLREGTTKQSLTTE